MKILFRHAVCLLAAAVPFAVVCAASAQETTPPPQSPAPAAETPKDGAKDLPITPEKAVATHHEIDIGGKSLKYTATAGTLLIRDPEDKPYGSIFYVAYTLDGADAASRPVSFLYNGGPGSSTLWLHMGSFSPVHVQTDSPNPTAGPPFKVVPNQDSLIDQTDLVFIDAPFTGYSRAVGKGTAKDLTGVDPDLRAFDRFIMRYLSVNQRWNSPKFLIGESYGTTRSAALADMLGGDGVQLNGVVLISSILNYGIDSGGYDLLYIGNLPSYAAAAWYFDKIPNKPASLSDWVQQAREFASGPYAHALYAGDALSAGELDSVVKQVSHFTGLSEDYVKECNLRIAPSRFRKEVLRDNRKTLGRYDMRFEGTDLDAAGENPGFDASDTGITGAFVSAFHDYLQRELKYDSTDEYRPTAYGLLDWDWKHRPGGRPAGPGGGRGGEQAVPYVAADLADAIRKNPHLRVFSANGYFDLATPFFITEYDIAHMGLDPALRGNIQFGYYPSGHMIYLNVDALHKLKADLAGFITKAE
jgi:carboxypeptidase C (cathepsin A)